jgi:glycosyltransferase involved in cell wall biosynthesis
MAHTVLLTIIMPIYNAERYLADALENIATQSFQDYELLLVDALSNDGTVDVIRKRQVCDQKIRLHSEKDSGIYDAMNKGLTLASGKWIYFMGCDDALYDSNVLKTIAPHLTNEVDLVYGDVIWVPENKKEEGVCLPAQLVDRNINHQRIFYRRELFCKWGGYDLQYKVASDHELNIRFFCNNCIRKQYVPVPITFYHSGGFSASQFDEVFWANWKKIFAKNLSSHLPVSTMYYKLGWYCRYQMGKQKYAKSFRLFLDVFFHTFSPGFVLLTLRHLIQSTRRHAS